MHKDLNETFLTLIHKKEGIIYPSEFILISLCNVVYKIITKVIANKLKPCLLALIPEEKTSYVEDKHIMDVIFLAHEAIHTIKYQKNLVVVIKLDMSKAFEKIS